MAIRWVRSAPTPQGLAYTLFRRGGADRKPMPGIPESVLGCPRPHYLTQSCSDRRSDIGVGVAEKEFEKDLQNGKPPQAPDFRIGTQYKTMSCSKTD
jgi:hypothetical protein